MTRSASVVGFLAAAGVLGFGTSARAQTHWYSESESVSTLTGTTQNDPQTKVTLQITVAAPTTVLIVSSALYTNSNTSSGLERQTEVFTEVDGQVYSKSRHFPLVFANYFQYAAHQILSLSAGTHTVKLRYATTSSVSVASIKQARILALQINPGNGGYFTSAATPETIATTTSSTFVNKQTLNFNPTPGIPYLIVGTADVTQADVISSAIARLAQSTGGTDVDQGEMRITPVRANFPTGHMWLSYATARVVTYSTSDLQTYNLQLKTSNTSWTSSIKNQRISAIPLASIMPSPTAARGYAETESATPQTALTTFQAKVSASVMPDASRYYMALGLGLMRNEATTASVTSKFDVDDVDTGTTTFRPQVSTQDYVSLFNFRRFSWASGSTHISTVFYATTVAGTSTEAYMKNAREILLPLGPAAAPPSPPSIAPYLIGTDRFSYGMKAGDISGGSVGTPYTPTGQPAFAGRQSQLVCVADFDKNGTMDIAYADGNTNDIKWVPRIGSGPNDFDWAEARIIDTLTPGTTATITWPAACGDVDGDGSVDIVTSFNYSSELAKFHVYRNNGDGSGWVHTSVASGNLNMSAMAGKALADFNGDGWADLAIFTARTSGASNSNITIFTNQCTSPSTCTTPYSSSAKTEIPNTSVLMDTSTPRWGALTTGDFDADGKMDIWAMGLTKKLYFYKGNGNLTFASPTNMRDLSGVSMDTWVIDRFDVSGDGKLDFLHGAGSSTDAKKLRWYAGDGIGGVAVGANQTLSFWGTNVAAPLDPQCQSRPNGFACDDGDPCSTADTCSAGRCMAGTPVSCEGGGACNPAGGCPPFLVLDFVTTRVRSCGPTLRVSGHVSGGFGPVAVTSTIAGSQHTYSVNPNGFFSEDVPVPVTPSTLTVYAADQFGGSFERSVPLDPGGSCLEDSCNNASLCDAPFGKCVDSFKADTTECADGTLCNGGEKCDGLGSCTVPDPGQPAPICTSTSCATADCVPSVGCTYDYSTTLCPTGVALAVAGLYDMTSGGSLPGYQGKVTRIAGGPDPTRTYLTSRDSGVWVSSDSGTNWLQRTYVGRPSSERLPVPYVYDLQVDSKASTGNTLFASIANDVHTPSRNGVYRSITGGESWERVWPSGTEADPPCVDYDQAVGTIAIAPDLDGVESVVFAAAGCEIRRSTMSGASGSFERVWPRAPGEAPIWHIAVSDKSLGARRVYALGTDGIPEGVGAPTTFRFSSLNGDTGTWNVPDRPLPFLSVGQFPDHNFARGEGTHILAVAPGVPDQALLMIAKYGHNAPAFARAGLTDGTPLGSAVVYDDGAGSVNSYDPAGDGLVTDTGAAVYKGMPLVRNANFWHFNCDSGLSAGWEYPAKPEGVYYDANGDGVKQSTDFDVLVPPTSCPGAWFSDGKFALRDFGDARLQIYAPRVSVPGQFPFGTGASLWLGRFDAELPADSARWVLVPSPPYIDGSGQKQPFLEVVKGAGGSSHILFSDSWNLFIAEGPASGVGFSSWSRLDGNNPHQKPPMEPFVNTLYTHVDLHSAGATSNLSVSLTPPIGVSFPYTLSSALTIGAGRLFMGNDGGYFYTSIAPAPGVPLGGWTQGVGLSTHNVMNITGIPVPKRDTAIYFGLADNGYRQSLDTGRTWTVFPSTDGQPVYADPGVVQAFYRNDMNFPDRMQRSQTDSPWEAPDLSIAANGAIITRPSDSSARGPNMIRGGKTFVYSPPTCESANPLLALIGRGTDGARYLYGINGGSLDSDSTVMDWDTMAFLRVPVPESYGNVLQAASATTCDGAATFFVGSPVTGLTTPVGDLRKYVQSTGVWSSIVPGGSEGRVAEMARRFFVNPYDPSHIYIIDNNQIMFSYDGGAHWDPADTDGEAPGAGLDDLARVGYSIDNRYIGAVSEDDIAFVYNNYSREVINDMAFSRADSSLRFAAGVAGVFMKRDGSSPWEVVLRSDEMQCIPVGLFHDTIRGDLYIATDGRGLLRYKL